MSIGTIDCTIEKKLCDTHKVRGYPTLKFSIDGEMYDYTNGRSLRDFVDFSQKMIRPIIDMVSSIDDAYQHMTDHTSDTNGVAFILYDPSITIIQQQQEKSRKTMIVPFHLGWILPLPPTTIFHLTVSTRLDQDN